MSRKNPRTSLVGTNPTGTWTVDLRRLNRTLRALAEHGAPPEPQIAIGFGGDRQLADSPTQYGPELGTCTTWDDREYTVVGVVLERLQLKANERSVSVDPSDLRSLRFFEACIRS